MLYFDNSSTSLTKPPEVARAVTVGLATFGNSGRSFHTPALNSAREIFAARAEIAELIKMENPLNIAFTSGATESLNLCINSLITPKEHVITTVLEHNSVLRPLYNLGCDLDFIDCDNSGQLILENLERLLKPNSKYIIATHGSNLLGSITDTKKLYAFAKDNNLVLILDTAQTLGCTELSADMADVICFTGHKSLFGPMGTGGIAVSRNLPFKAVKTGGSGQDSFSLWQALTMPDIFEAGTLNAHGLAGLRAGTEFVNSLSVEKIQAHTTGLTSMFLDGISNINKIKVYGSLSPENRLSIVSLNIGDFPADQLAMKLWEDYEIATRAGSHCAPLVHQRFGTVKQGMVRFSFGYFNTSDEIETAIIALERIAREVE